jgi:hypothetical protein
MLIVLLHSIICLFEALGDSALFVKGMRHKPVQRPRCPRSRLVLFLVMTTC